MRETDSRKLSVEALNDRRRQVMECRKRGMTQAAAGEQCGMSVVTVWTVQKLYAQGGAKAIGCTTPAGPWERVYD